MQIVIEIDDVIFERARAISEGSIDEWQAMRAIANGTPLPKNHGRLIDADALDIYDVSPAYGMEVYGVTQDDIADAPTIIEAEVRG